ncbi:MAG: hypothetical protein LBC67_05870 [Spirochaetales bacterium]|nr:hypothetical protein [Spirochaetales bacterium]
MRKLTKILGIIAIGAVITLGFASCTTYKPVDVTNAMAAQVEKIKFYTPQPGEQVKTIYASRTGSFVKDMNELEGGVWYRTHQDKIVSIDAVLEIKTFISPVAQYDRWCIEYVD